MDFSEVQSDVPASDRAAFRAFVSQYTEGSIERKLHQVEALYRSYDFSHRTASDADFCAVIAELFITVHHYLLVALPLGQPTVEILRHMEDLFSEICAVPDTYGRARAEVIAEAFAAWSKDKEKQS